MFALQACSPNETGARTAKVTVGQSKTVFINQRPAISLEVSANDKPAAALMVNCSQKTGIEHSDNVMINGVGAAAAVKGAESSCSPTEVAEASADVLIGQ